MDFAAVALVALAAALGFVLGVVVGARRAVTLLVSGRALRATNARMASFLPQTIPARSSADILAGRVRIGLGGSEYSLPVLPRAASRRWLEALDARFAALAAALDAADTPGIMALLAAETDALYDMLLLYDDTHVLPDRAAIDEVATDAQVLHAVLEVWRAAHPLLGTVIDATEASPTPGPSSAPASSPPMPTAGAPTTSSTA